MNSIQPLSREAIECQKVISGEIFVDHKKEFTSKYAREKFAEMYVKGDMHPIYLNLISRRIEACHVNPPANRVGIYKDLTEDELKRCDRLGTIFYSCREEIEQLSPGFPLYFAKIERKSLLSRIVKEIIKEHNSKLLIVSYIAFAIIVAIYLLATAPPLYLKIFVLALSCILIFGRAVKTIFELYKLERNIEQGVFKCL
jgi:hypothetical protein